MRTAHSFVNLCYRFHNPCAQLCKSGLLDSQSVQQFLKVCAIGFTIGAHGFHPPLSDDDCDCFSQSKTNIDSGAALSSSKKMDPNAGGSLQVMLLICSSSKMN